MAIHSMATALTVLMAMVVDLVLLVSLVVELITVLQVDLYLLEVGTVGETMRIQMRTITIQPEYVTLASLRLLRLTTQVMEQLPEERPTVLLGILAHNT